MGNEFKMAEYCDDDILRRKRQHAQAFIRRDHITDHTITQRALIEDH